MDIDIRLILLILLASVSCSQDVIDDSNDDLPDQEIPVPEPELPENIIPEHDFILGSLCGFEGDLRKCTIYEGEGKPSTYYNVPLFEVTPEGTENGWWDNLVEEISYSGLDYIMMNCRGLQPSFPEKYIDHGDPTHIARLVEAMKRRGVETKFKIAVFDDCPASWEAARNEDLGRGYAGFDANNPGERRPYPLKDIEPETPEFQDSIYKYIWDFNIRIALQNIPEEYIFKYNGRPVIFFWGCGFVGDVPGKLSYILHSIRQDCMKEFNMDPFLVIDQDWLNKDKTLNEANEDIGAVNNWFNMSDPYTTRRFNDITVGVGIPGFSVNDLIGDRMFVHANHGKTLTDAMSRFAENNADLVLIEGFTDVLENAALWRSSDETYYDYPNQRLNILRKWSSNPYPDHFRVEIEACDMFRDKSAGNSGGQYRTGDMDIVASDDVFGGWHVTDVEAGEWMKWIELPFSSGESIVKLRYRSDEDCTVYLDVEGAETKDVMLEKTGEEWKDAEICSVNFDEDAWHMVTLNILSGRTELNYFEIISNK